MERGFTEVWLDLLDTWWRPIRCRYADAHEPKHITV